jgi:hypothetical protein
MNTRTQLQEIRRDEAPVRGEVEARRNDAAIAMSFPLSGPCRMPAPVPVPVKLPVPVRRPLDRVRGAWNLLAALTALTALSAAAPAHAAYGDFTADGRVVDVGIRVEGQRAPLFVKHGDWNRWYFQAFEGRNYSLVLRNNTGRRIGVLVAVDGLNVVNGEKSRLKSGEPMYVLGPWGTAEISGWRTSLKQIRRFVFVDEEVSYAARTGQANGDMGWIRVLAFEEQRPWNDITPELRYDNGPRSGRETPGNAGDDRVRREAPEAQSAPRAAEPEGADRKAQQFHGGQQSVPGTGWGERDHDPVRRVDFDPARHAAEQLVFRYEYASGLRALGIFPPRRGRVWERDGGDLGFAKPPKW